MEYNLINYIDNNTPFAIGSSELEIIIQKECGRKPFCVVSEQLYESESR